LETVARDDVGLDLIVRVGPLDAAVEVHVLVLATDLDIDRGFGGRVDRHCLCLVGGDRFATTERVRDSTQVRCDRPTTPGAP
jgi:hypothetical protein